MDAANQTGLFAGPERIQLDPRSWVDYVPGWASDHEALFDELVAVREWRQRTRWMYEKQMLEPRLTSMWLREEGVPLVPARVEAMRARLSDCYGVDFDSVGFNLYRDGQDSVAWHRDKIRQEIAEPIVALVSLGEPRRFLLRPRGGGPSRRFELGRGDLIVTAGRTQRDWEHTVPKVAQAGKRISIAFRHGMNANAYGR
jgi:alkylated DNA repair dioxygenase AlkB